MPINTQYNPQRDSEYVKDNMKFAGQKIYLEVLPASTGFKDLVLSEDYLIDGAEVLVENGNIKDEIFMQIIHPVYGVVDEFISGWAISKDSVTQSPFKIKYNAKLVAGLSIRCKYVTAEGGVTRNIAINLYLHKVLN